jgi:hypothetical protein
MERPLRGRRRCLSIYSGFTHFPVASRAVPSGHGSSGGSVPIDPRGIASGFTVIAMHLPLSLRNDPAGQGCGGSVAAGGRAVIVGGHRHTPSCSTGQFPPGQHG